MGSNSHNGHLHQHIVLPGDHTHLFVHMVFLYWKSKSHIFFIKNKIPIGVSKMEGSNVEVVMKWMK